MTQEDKQLLLIDLCARLPYNEVRVTNGKRTLILAPASKIEEIIDAGYLPYLRSINSMTEDEKKEWVHLRTEVEKYTIGYNAVVDFYNAHHFDYRGLLYDDLAIEAPEWMYKTE